MVAKQLPTADAAKVKPGGQLVYRRLKKNKQEDHSGNGALSRSFVSFFRHLVAPGILPDAQAQKEC